jgi:hypothetical protein
MSIFLIVYDRKTGHLAQITEFAESDRAEARRQLRSRTSAQERTR